MKMKDKHIIAMMTILVTGFPAQDGLSRCNTARGDNIHEAFFHSPKTGRSATGSIQYTMKFTKTAAAGLRLIATIIPPPSPPPLLQPSRCTETRCLWLLQCSNEYTGTTDAAVPQQEQSGLSLSTGQRLWWCKDLIHLMLIIRKNLMTPINTDIDQHHDVADTQQASACCQLLHIHISTNLSE